MKITFEMELDKLSLWRILTYCKNAGLVISSLKYGKEETKMYETEKKISTYCEDFDIKEKALS